MGIRKSTYLIFGVEISEKKLLEWGFIGLYDDKLLSFVEGRPGAAFDIVSGESDKIYAGNVLAKSEYDQEDACTMIPLDFQPIYISNKLILAGLHVKHEQVHLYFVDVWK